MKILHVLQPEAGGVPEHVLRLSEGLIARGLAVEVATPPGSAVLASLQRAGAVIHPVAMDREPGAGDLQATRALRSLVAARRPDIVHAHSSKAGALVRGGLPGRRHSVYTPHCFAFAAGFGGTRKRLYRAAEQVLLPFSARVIAASEWERRAGLDELIGAAKKIDVVRNGVPPCADAHPAAALGEWAAGEPLAGMVAELRQQKDPLTLVRAAAHPELRERRVAIVGNGALADAVRAEAGPNVRVFGFDGDVAPYLHALDVFVLPSLWESLPLAVLEAMACGLPVVATPVGGVGEAVADGVNGRLVPPGDPAGLAGALAGLLADAGERERMGAESRTRAERDFGVDRMVEQTLAIYREVAVG